MAVQLTFDESYFEEEALIEHAPLSTVARHAMARMSLEAEEEVAAESRRPTVPVFLTEPWR